MCGRFYLDVAREQLKDHYELPLAPDLVPRFNIAPSQDILVVRVTPGHKRECVPLHWGLIPGWAMEEKTPYHMINARAETLAEKPAFRTAYRHRRCLIPVSGFYEWQAKGKQKQPYAIGMKDGGIFSLAGLWEHWEGLQGKIVESCTIIVTDANKLLAPIHERMPLIIAVENYARWLDPDIQDPDRLRTLLRPFPAGRMQAHTVSQHVNNPENDNPECIAAITATEKQ
jgi:putative SOS response-associated peptidase YedK